MNWKFKKGDIVQHESRKEYIFLVVGLGNLPQILSSNSHYLRPPPIPKISPKYQCMALTERARSFYCDSTNIDKLYIEQLYEKIAGKRPLIINRGETK
jgi:hypothetical protein